MIALQAILVAAAALCACAAPPTGAGAAAPESQREAALRKARDLPSGAVIVDTPRGQVLVANATVPVQADGRPDRAFAAAAAAAIIEAHAEAALFLEGTYSSSTESSTKSSSASDGSARREAWVRTHFAAMAQARLAGGVPLQVARCEGGVRAIVAWGLAEADQGRVPCDEAALGAIADAAIAAGEVPACDLRWVKDPAGREGIRIMISIHPDALTKGCTRGEEGKPPCSCATCRERVLEILLQRTVAGWAQEGDVGVARTLNRAAGRTVTRAKDGAEAVQKTSSRTFDRSTVNAQQAVIPPDFFTKSTRVQRHADRRSVCVAFVPIEATKPTPAAPGAVRGTVGN